MSRRRGRREKGKGRRRAEGGREEEEGRKERGERRGGGGGEEKEGEGKLHSPLRGCFSLCARRQQFGLVVHIAECQMTERSLYKDLHLPRSPCSQTVVSG